MTDTVELRIAVLGHEPQVTELAKRLNQISGVKAKAFDRTKDWEAATQGRALSKHRPYDVLVLPWPDDVGGEEDMHFGLLSFDSLKVGKPQQAYMYVEPKKGVTPPLLENLPKSHLHRLFRGTPEALVRKALEQARRPVAAAA
jgi:hypothetical protein